MAALVLTVLALTVRPHPPAPVGAGPAWSQRAAPALGALARDVGTAAAEPSMKPATVTRIRGDAGRVEAVGAPPDPGRAAAWRRALPEVNTALDRYQAQPAAAREALQLAGLELVDLAQQP